MKKIPPIIWGIILITIIFSMIVILINGIGSLRQVFSRPAETTPIAENTRPASIDSTALPSPTPADNRSWVNQRTVLFFPALPMNIYQYSLIQIKNTDAAGASDIKVSLLNRLGESRTYPVSNLDPGSINRFSLTNLAELPLNFSPGLVIISSNSNLAAVAEIFPANSEEKIPSESLSPFSELPSDLNYTVYPSTDNEPSQNQLAITNPSNKLIEAQVTVTTPEEGSRIIFTDELSPWTTRIIELPIPKFKSFDQTATVIASSTDRIIGVIYHLDKDGGLMSNINTK